MTYVYLLLALVMGVVLHELAGKYISGYRTIVANLGYAASALFIWFTTTDWGAVISDPKDLFLVISGQSLLTIYQQVRSEQRAKARAAEREAVVGE